jgi:hypothetical protein
MNKSELKTIVQCPFENVPGLQDKYGKDDNPNHLLTSLSHFPYPAMILQVVVQRQKRQLYACFPHAKNNIVSHIATFSRDGTWGTFF